MMQNTIQILVFIFGVFVGSFLNVLILRHKTGRGIVGGRSFCLSCKRTLLAKDLVPVLSFIVLRGRCRRCKAKLSTQYPLVELTNGILYALAFSLAIPVLKISVLVGVTYLILLFVVSSIFLSIFVYDIKHKIIPNSWVYILIAVSALFLFINPASGSFTAPSVLEIFGGPLVALPFALIWLFSAGRWMGLGDAKLVWPFGWILSISSAYTAVFFGFWIGALFALVLMALQNLKTTRFIKGPKLGLKSEIPFGPFLILGFFIVLYTGFNLFSYIWY